MWLLEGRALWDLGGGFGGVSPVWQGHQHHCLSLHSKLHYQEVNEGSQAEKPGEQEHLGAQDSAEIGVTAPEAPLEMEISQTLHLLPWMEKMNLKEGLMVTGLWRGSGGTKGQGRGERILVYGWTRWARREGSDDSEEDVIRNGQGLKSTEHSNTCSTPHPSVADTFYWDVYTNILQQKKITRNRYVLVTKVRSVRHRAKTGKMRPRLERKEERTSYLLTVRTS